MRNPRRFEICIGLSQRGLAALCHPQVIEMYRKSIDRRKELGLAEIKDHIITQQLKLDGVRRTATGAGPADSH